MNSLTFKDRDGQAPDPDPRTPSGYHSRARQSVKRYILFYMSAFEAGIAADPRDEANPTPVSTQPMEVAVTSANALDRCLSLVHGTLVE